MNSEDIIAKLESIFLELNITPSMFADQIGVQRSSISHLLSGRNKPSLDLVLKIVNAFPQIDLYWLLGQKELKEKLNLKIKNDQSPPTEKVENIKIEEPLKTKKADSKIEVTKTTTNSKSSEVEKIVVFYRDGTFLEYAPRES
ncbi:helix-turn-helix domain-containing protein [Flavobacterium ardleyense]|uniref:helix-turn-helix domain-containing protein n=1 Tax=Flavobacterium ardleyense TaxID=2038737 RepID=UPI00298C656D|nr:helix-turn-helix transcriptional regulator [Flavobacterium ardleyense]